MYYKQVTISLIILLSLISCQREHYETVDCYEYDYSDCNTTEPLEGNIRIDLTINKANPEVEVIIFNGQPEDRDTFTTAKVNNAVLEVVVPLNKFYSVQAKYKVNGNTVYATDGNEIKSYYFSRCDSLCWSIKGKYMDARLKYDNI